MKANAPFTYSIQMKNGKNQVVFSFKDDNGKRKLKWISTKLDERCNKKELKEKVSEIVKDFTKMYNSGEATKVKTPKTDKTSISEYALGNLANGKSDEYKFSDFLTYRLENSQYICSS